MPPSPATVAAIVTPPGQGGIGIVQVVGQQAVELVDGLFRPARGTALADAADGRLLYGRIVDAGRVLDEVIVAVYPPRDSLLGEPTVEINCHGGIAAVRAVLDAVVARGAVKVAWQELLNRAAACGHLDAIRAQAVRLLATALSPLAVGMLLDQGHGALSRAVEAAAACFDAGDAQTARSQVRELLATADLGRALVVPPRVVIAGAPNVGKSTLFNAILGHPRVIVADLPGTTRDAIAETIVLDGLPFELTDTAGLRDSAHIVEVESVKGTWRRLAEADVVLMLFDGTRPVQPEEWRIVADLRAPRLVPVVSKCDRPLGIDVAEVERRCGCAACRTAAVDGTGLRELEARLVDCVPGRDAARPGSAVVFTRRQAEALTRALEVPDAEAADRLRQCLRE